MDLTEILGNLLPAVIVAILIIVYGLLIDAWWLRIGAVREGYKWPIVVCTLFGVTLKIIWFRSISWWSYTFILALGVTFINRSDLNNFFLKGTWWWNSKKK